MIGIKNVYYQKNGTHFMIDIGEKNSFRYQGISKTIKSLLVFEYLDSLFHIIDDWKKEYISTAFLDGNEWKLSITYIDGKTKEYSGKACFPNNFEAFERLNQKLIEEVYHGSISN